MAAFFVFARGVYPYPSGMILRRVFPVFSNDSAGGALLIFSAFMALILANGSLAPFYFQLLDSKLAGLSVLHWINDGLMAIFFLFVGLEIKRELLQGEMATWQRRTLPGLAALGGMVVPMLLFAAFNLDNPAALRGIPIPAATDIAFALGILAFLGSRVPVSLKIFLTALAILDDMGAIAIIAALYTDNLNTYALGLALCTLAWMALTAFWQVRSLWIYGALIVLVWAFTLHSGIHATLAGVAAACLIPLGKQHSPQAPLIRLEHGLRPWVNFAILPVFGLANAGIQLGNIGWYHLQSPLVVGIVAGLFIGKQLGVVGAAWIAIRLGWATLPHGSTWLQLYGVAVLCGIGFTMSLFMGLLAFSTPSMQEAVKLGVLIASALSAILGVVVLLVAARQPK